MLIDVRAHARRVLDELHEEVGVGGFHPDSEIEDYVEADGSPPEWSEEDKRLMQAALEFCRAALGDECCELGLAKMEAARTAPERESFGAADGDTDEVTP